MILNTTSLVKTIDSLNEKILHGEQILPDEGLQVARWIASRQGEKGSYRGLFAPTPYDFEQGIRVFTGERLVAASARHIMGQEAARSVRLLGYHDPIVRAAYDRAVAWMQDDTGFRHSGTYCCGRCTLAYWRHYWVVDCEHKETMLSIGFEVMKDRRDGEGGWHTFPFFYAIYTLAGIDLEPAHAELEYARPVIERYLKRKHTDTYSQRRKAIFEQALDKLN